MNLFEGFRVGIENNEEYSLQLKILATNWKNFLLFFENTGILMGVRMNAAADEALDLYSPKKIE